MNFDFTCVLGLVSFIGLLVVVSLMIPANINAVRKSSIDPGKAGEIAYFDANGRIGGFPPQAQEKTEGFIFVNTDSVADIQLIDLGDNKQVTGILQDASIPLFIGDVQNNATARATLTIQLGAVDNSKLANDSVSTNKIQDGAVTDAKSSLSNKPLVTLVADTNQNLGLAPVSPIDGVVLTTGMIILLTAETDKTENGPWVIDVGAGTWTRPDWYMDGSTTQAHIGDTTVATQGTVYHGTRWYLSAASSDPITIDFTDTTWTMIGTSPMIAPLVIVGKANNALQVIPESGGSSSFVVDDSTATKLSGTGVKIQSLPQGSGAKISAVSTQANESLHLNSLGNADLLLQSDPASTGKVLAEEALAVKTTSVTAFTVSNESSTVNAFQVDTNAVAKSANLTGLKITAAAIGGTGTTITTTSTGADEPLSISALGAGQLKLNTAVGSTGTILVGTNIVFTDADHSLSFGSTGLGFPRTLAIQGNQNDAAGGGGLVNITGGKANSAGTDGGDVNIAGGASAVSGAGGDLNLKGGAPVLGAGGDISLIGTSANGSGNFTGGAVSITTGSSTGGGAAGAFTVTTGTGGGLAGQGGNVTMNLGAGSGSGPGAIGGSFNVKAGDGGSGTGGAITLITGQGGTSAGAGGDLTLTASKAVAGNSNGGSVLITAGTAAGTGNAGVVSILGGNATTGNAGSVSIDVGSGTKNGSINIGLGTNTPLVTYVNQLGYQSKVMTITSGSNTIAATDSGKVILVDTTLGYTTKLPLAINLVAGMRYEFINRVPGAAVVIASAVANKLAGTAVVQGAATLGSTAGATTSIAFTAASLQGDRIELIYDGDTWSATGSTSFAAGIAFA